MEVQDERRIRELRSEHTKYVCTVHTLRLVACDLTAVLCQNQLLIFGFLFFSFFRLGASLSLQSFFSKPFRKEFKFYM